MTILGAHVLAPDLAAALRRLSGVLRRATERVATSSRRPALYAGTHGALVGWDAAAGSMVAYRFTASECFVAMLDDAQTVPPPLHDAGTRPDGPPGVATIAARQLLHLREALPHAVGGPVHAAVIRPGSITCQRVCDLVEAAPIRATV